MSTIARSEANSHVLRLLVPITADEASRWGIRYALQRQRAGNDVEVVLLNVGEPVTQWQVLRFRTQQEISDFQAARAQSFIAEASEVLSAEQIRWRGVFKQGELVFSILDAAEELECDEIVMPAPRKGLASLFADDTVSAVRAQQRDVPVVVVGNEGMPV